MIVALEEGVMLRIELRSLDAGYHEFSLEPAPTDLGLEPSAFRDMLVEVGLDYEGKTALVVVKVSAIAALICDRTLADFEQSVCGEYTVLFSSDKDDSESMDEVRNMSATDEELDITDIVRDTLLLAIPVRKIAPGAEDADIPAAFGAPTKSDCDPRWEALRSLKNKESGES